MKLFLMNWLKRKLTIAGLFAVVLVCGFWICDRRPVSKASLAVVVRGYVRRVAKNGQSVIVANEVTNVLEANPQPPEAS